ncbi:hypothetical protein [Streptomyces sp. NPDC007117]|uniref:hypothetical protein n=1 Tax=Streptomyces sp. NPDC007117 TaxID=3154314 RepID=UPI0034099019
MCIPLRGFAMADPRDRQRKPPQRSERKTQVKTEPSTDDPHQIVYFRRHLDEDAAETCPGREFMQQCPSGVRAKLKATLTAVAGAPPKRFSGGGFWEAMSRDMTGWYEVRRSGPQRAHYRLFCRLDYEARGFDKPLLVVITGLQKPNATLFSDADYQGVRDLGDEYFSRNPRSIA